MAIAEDATTPGAKTGSTGSGTLTVTSNSFSPPASSLLVAIFGIGHGTPVPSVTISDSGSHTWTTGPIATQTNCWVGISWVYLSSAPGSITVSGANSTVEGQSAQLDVRVLTGAASTQSGAGSNHTTGSSTSWTASLTTTEVGSWVYLSICGNSQEATLTPNANTSTLNNFQAVAGSSVVSARQSSGTGTTSPGATTFGYTVGTTTGWAWAGLEFLPATTTPHGLIVGQSVKRAAFY